MNEKVQPCQYRHTKNHTRTFSMKMSVNERRSITKKDPNILVIKKYNNYFRDIKWLLKITGLWPKSHSILQYFMLCLALSTTSFTCFGSLLFCLHNILNIMELTRGIGLFISVVSTILKISTFLLHRNDIIQLNNLLSNQYENDLTNKKYQSLALNRFHEFAHLFYVLTTSILVTSILTSIIIPLLALFHGKYIPVIPSTFPFSYDPGSLIYWSIQIINMIAAFFVWSTTSGVDSAFGLYTLQMCGELRILAYEFENLGFSKNYKNDFKECIRRHYLIMKSKYIMQKIFGFLSIFLAITSAFSQCTLVFQITEVLKSMNPTEMIFIFVFLLLKIIQAFMYAWYGSLITEESKSCLDSIYNASWPGSRNKRFMNDLYIVLSQRPLVFIAKGWMNVKMELFSRVLQTSVSYFFLLRTLDEDSRK